MKRYDRAYYLHEPEAERPWLLVLWDNLDGVKQVYRFASFEGLLNFARTERIEVES